MSLSVWQRTITTTSGDVVPGAEITVVVEATGLPAQIYSDRNKTIVLSNPFFADSSGFARFYAEPGEYRITASGASGVITWRYVLVGSSAGLQSYDNSASGLESTTTQGAIDELIIQNSETATVGATGDFATINQALGYYSKRAPVYKSAGIQVTLQLQAGFVMSEQVLVRGLDLGWITITGVDAQTTIDHTALTTNFTLADYGFTTFPAFGVSKGGVLPRVGQLFIFSAANVGGSKHGAMAVGAGSGADVLVGCGVGNAGTYGIFATHGSIINAEAVNASGAGTYGIFATRASTVNANGANTSGAGDTGVVANLASAVNANSADASGSGTYGIFATRGSIINAESANARRGAEDSTSDFVVARGSHLAAFSAIGGTSQAVNTLTASGIIYK